MRGRYSYEQFRSGHSNTSVERGDLIRSFHAVGASVHGLYPLTRYQMLIPKLQAETELTEDVDGRTETRDNNEKTGFNTQLQL